MRKRLKKRKTSGKEKQRKSERARSRQRGRRRVKNRRGPSCYNKRSNGLLDVSLLDDASRSNRRERVRASGGQEFPIDASPSRKEDRGGEMGSNRPRCTRHVRVQYAASIEKRHVLSHVERGGLPGARKRNVQAPRMREKNLKGAGGASQKNDIRRRLRRYRKPHDPIFRKDHKGKRLAVAR